jgi:hypothetical protein
MPSVSWGGVLWRIRMKKYIIMGSIAAFVLVSVSVFALQSKSGQDTVVQASVAQEVAPQPAPAAGTSSGCGNAAGGCGSSSAGCGGAAGGCGVSDVDPAASKERLDGIKLYLAKYYSEKLGLLGVTVEVESFGCHEEATVTADGKVIDRLSISGNSITKIES